jgi:hypothetical protein
MTLDIDSIVIYNLSARILSNLSDRRRQMGLTWNLVTYIPLPLLDGPLVSLEYSVSLLD